MMPLHIQLACGLTVDIQPSATVVDDIVVLVRPTIADFVVFATETADRCRTAACTDEPGKYSLWIGRTSIELDNHAQAQQAAAWIDAHRERIQQAERVGVLQA